MRIFALSMVITCVLGFAIALPYQVLSGTNSAETESVTIKQVINPSDKVTTVSEDVVNANTITIKELNTKGSVVIQLNTEVTEQTVNVVIDKIKTVNRENKVKSIYLLLDSPGGSVFDGARLITAMDASKLPVYTVCTEGCYSMAAQILEHGKERYAVDRATIMFHPASTSLMWEGEVDKIFSRIEHSKRFIDKLDAYNAKRCGMTYENFKSKVAKEFWLDSEDALENHLIDSIVSINFEKELLPPGPQVGNQLKLNLKE